jgi:molecular chaperone GrpE
MMEKEILENSGQPGAEGNVEQDTAFDNAAGPDDRESAGETAPDGTQNEMEKLRAEINGYKEKYLRQVAEFDNFRKRNNRERLELIQTAGKDVIASLLDVMDDCDRAQQQMDKSQDIDSLKEGVLLVFNKLRNTLTAKGLRPMESIGQDFNPDLHEAVTEIPVPENMKGKVVDEIQKGYYLNDKIIRFAKVVVGK